MRACLLISERGVEKLCSLGEGARSTREARLVDWIWPEVLAFHEAIRARTRFVRTRRFVAEPKAKERPVLSVT